MSNIRTLHAMCLCVQL